MKYLKSQKQLNETSENIKKYKEIYDLAISIGEGLHHCIETKSSFLNLTKKNINKGWISIDYDDDGSLTLMWTSHKDHHEPWSCGFLNVMAITIHKDGLITLVSESAITMHEVTDEKRKQQIINFIYSRLKMINKND